MPLGSSLFLIAVGAILRYAVSVTVSGVSLTTIGLILMVVGAAGMLLSILYMLRATPRDGVVRERERIIDRDPLDHQRGY
jgi:Domain of unknown function (DUF6458)